MSDKYSFENYILRCEAGKIEDERDALTAKIETLTAENARLREALERFAKIDLTGPIGESIVWDILNARAALGEGK